MRKSRLPLCMLLLLLLPIAIFAQAPLGHIAHYKLDNSLTDESANSYNGTLTATTATTDRFGVVNRATAFTAGSSYGDLPLALQTNIQNSFSFSFWFKTTLNASGFSQWYEGNAIFDAEMCGNTSDWGIAMIDGGKIGFGIGNADVTIKSPLNYNDDNWHFVTATRDHTAGSITLFVDGAQVATAGGTYTGALTAPTYIGVSRNPCVDFAYKYAGSLDEVIIYDRALTPTETTALYNFSVSSTLPLDWVSFTGRVHENTVKLNWEVDNVVNNDHFEVEYAIDGLHFIKAGSVAANNSVSKYTFSVGNLSTGNYYFRIKQVDLDGRYTYSKIIQLTTRISLSSIYLQGNPVNQVLLLMNPDQESIQQFMITDVTGKLIQRKQLTTTSTVITGNVAGLKPGHYVVSLVTRKGVTALPFIKK